MTKRLVLFDDGMARLFDGDDLLWTSPKAFVSEFGEEIRDAYHEDDTMPEDLANDLAAWLHENTDEVSDGDELDIEFDEDDEDDDDDPDDGEREAA